MPEPGRRPNASPFPARLKRAHDPKKITPAPASKPSKTPCESATSFLFTKKQQSRPSYNAMAESLPCRTPAIFAACFAINCFTAGISFRFNALVQTHYRRRCLPSSQFGSGYAGLGEVRAKTNTVHFTLHWRYRYVTSAGSDICCERSPGFPAVSLPAEVTYRYAMP